MPLVYVLLIRLDDGYEHENRLERVFGSRENAVEWLMGRYGDVKETIYANEYRVSNGGASNYIATIKGMRVR